LAEIAAILKGGSPGQTVWRPIPIVENPAPKHRAASRSERRSTTAAINRVRRPAFGPRIVATLPANLQARWIQPLSLSCRGFAFSEAVGMD
jgi:hypothetical protein